LSPNFKRGSDDEAHDERLVVRYKQDGDIKLPAGIKDWQLPAGGITMNVKVSADGGKTFEDAISGEHVCADVQLVQLDDQTKPSIVLLIEDLKASQAEVGHRDSAFKLYIQHNGGRLTPVAGVEGDLSPRGMAVGPKGTIVVSKSLGGFVVGKIVKDKFVVQHAQDTGKWRSFAHLGQLMAPNADALRGLGKIIGFNGNFFGEQNGIMAAANGFGVIASADSGKTWHELYQIPHTISAETNEVKRYLEGCVSARNSLKPPKSKDTKQYDYEHPTGMFNDDGGYCMKCQKDYVRDVFAGTCAKGAGDEAGEGPDYGLLTYKGPSPLEDEVSAASANALVPPHEPC